MEQLSEGSAGLELSIRSGVGPGQEPLVKWSYGEHQGELSPAEARSRAHHLLRVGYLAAAVAAIAQQVWGVAAPPSKGFGREPVRLTVIHPKGVRGRQKALPQPVIDILRFLSPVLDFEGIEVMLAVRRAEEQKLEPVIELSESWYGEKIPLPLDRLQHHAIGLLEGAESAETDGFLYFFLEDRLDFERIDMGVLMMDFQRFRQTQSLESLLHLGGEA